MRANSDRPLSLKALNRATLARNFLLERESHGIHETVSRLVGMQAQSSAAPFIGLWSRLAAVERQQIAAAIDDRSLVKATWIRGTLHLCTAEDYLHFRTTLQSMLSAGWATMSKDRGSAFDLNEMIRAVTEFVQETPRTFAEISDFLVARYPQYDVGAMRYAFRMHVPLAQVPNESEWKYPANPKFTLAEPWLGHPVSAEHRLQELMRRYLAAFGPASVADAQSWFGLSGLKETFEALRPELIVLRDEGRRELFDLPGQPLPDPETPAPVRFLPEFDDILLSHSNRRWVISDERRKAVYLPALRVAPTVLVDGFVRGVWKSEKKAGVATLAVELFDQVASDTRLEMEAEAEQLVRFIHPDAKTFDIRINA